MAEIILTDQNFEEEVLKAEKIVLVDFWAPWCPPCLLLGPIIKEIAEEYKDKIKVGKLNVDQNQYIAQKYKIRSIPTIIIFNKGKQEMTFIGLQPKENIKQAIDKILIQHYDSPN